MNKFLKMSLLSLSLVSGFSINAMESPKQKAKLALRTLRVLNNTFDTYKEKKKQEQAFLTISYLNKRARKSLSSN